jgi:hypothetical protein
MGGLAGGSGSSVATTTAVATVSVHPMRLSQRPPLNAVRRFSFGKLQTAAARFPWHTPHESINNINHRHENNSLDCLIDQGYINNKVGGYHIGHDR